MKNLLSPLFVAASLIVGASAPAHAFNPQPDPPGRWAMLGLVADQTARLTVLAVPVARGAGVRSCTVTLNFLDADGVQMTEASTLVLVPGKAKSVDLKGSSLRLASRSDRAQFRAQIDVLHNPPTYLPCAGVAATLEVFDATGHTSALVVHPVQD